MFRKKTRFMVFVLIFIGIINFYTGCDAKQNSKSGQISFDNFTNEVFLYKVQSDTLSLNYSLADPESFGIDNDQITLGEYTIERMEKELSQSEKYLNRLKKFDYEALTKEQQLTYDILKNYLELDLNIGDYLYYIETLGPTTGIQAQLPILLAEYNFYSREDIDTYLELLPYVYKYFQDIAQFEREKSNRGLFMTDRVADRIIDQCKAFIEDPEDNFLIEYFNEKIADYKGLTDTEIASYQRTNRERVLQYIIPSYELLINALEDLKGTGINEAGLYYYPEGQTYYEYMAKAKTGSDKDMEAMADMLEAAIGDGILKITLLSLSDAEIMNKLNEFTSFPITDPEDILDDLQTDISLDFPEPVPVECQIKYVDDSLSEYLSPAMMMKPYRKSIPRLPMRVTPATYTNVYISGARIRTRFAAL